MRTERGGTGTVISIAAALVILLLVLLVGLHYENVAGTPKKPGLASHSQSEEQLQLCVEGRPSGYGDPPSAAEQSICDRYLAGQAAGDDGAPPVPSTTAPQTGATHSTTPTITAAQNAGTVHAPSIPGTGATATTTTLPDGLP